MGEEFERNKPVELGVLRLLHDTHAAFAELLEDFVMGNDRGDQGNLIYSDLKSVQPTGMRQGHAAEPDSDFHDLV